MTDNEISAAIIANESSLNPNYYSSQNKKKSDHQLLLMEKYGH